ncbi:hypothetical protein PMIN01_04291 [Paraphaeosphaeria minitans]|uniref:Uncharacterized protein n=1 Tax=Paraphaeosphaeria minitans TaxID=565426 RepID=A0A9P6GIZ1_9PLEO|nr:hypothetical protein PMIN01_04291 [Paraphaeosphaeria minitans]
MFPEAPFPAPIPSHPISSHLFSRHESDDARDRSNEQPYHRPPLDVRPMRLESRRSRSRPGLPWTALPCDTSNSPPSPVSPAQDLPTGRPSTTTRLLHSNRCREGCYLAPGLHTHARARARTSHHGRRLLCTQQVHPGFGIGIGFGFGFGFGRLGSAARAEVGSSVMRGRPKRGRGRYLPTYLPTGSVRLDGFG